MKRSILVYAVSVALGAFLLQWLEYQHAVRVLSTEIYVGIVALVFVSLGLWVGRRVASPKSRSAFRRNDEALEYLGITPREFEVLGLLAEGLTNEEIANSMFVSTNTVKSHLAHVYEKLDVSRRTQAVQKARHLRLLP